MHTTMLDDDALVAIPDIAATPGLEWWPFSQWVTRRLLRPRDGGPALRAIWVGQRAKVTPRLLRQFLEERKSWTPPPRRRKREGGAK